MFILDYKANVIPEQEHLHITRITAEWFITTAANSGSLEVAAKRYQGPGY